MILFEKIEVLKNKDDMYDINSFNYEYLSKLTTDLIYNIIFYLELFAKSYIKLNNFQYKNRHNLKYLLNNVKKVMFNKKMIL